MGGARERCVFCWVLISRPREGAGGKISAMGYKDTLAPCLPASLSCFLLPSLPICSILNQCMHNVLLAPTQVHPPRVGSLRSKRSLVARPAGNKALEIRASTRLAPSWS